MNFASSDIFSGVHGGSHVSSISTSSTPGTSGRDAVDVFLDHRAGRAAHRREAVDDLHLRAVDLDVVQQAEVDDVHPELGILDLAQRFDHVVFRESHAASLALDCRRPARDHVPHGSAERHRHAPVHRHRGIDAPARSARRWLRGRTRRAPAHVRAAVAAHGGVEVDTQGDAFFCVFSRARDAVLAASDAQTALSGTQVRVRMGIHTGEPALTDEGYVGIDVHRGARICAAAHGGQILVSTTTRELLDGTVELLRPRRAPTQGPRRAAAPLPGSRRRARGDRLRRRARRRRRRTCRARRRRSSAAATTSRPWSSS